MHCSSHSLGCLSHTCKGVPQGFLPLCPRVHSLTAILFKGHAGKVLWKEKCGNAALRVCMEMRSGAT
eukprot:354386-Chlamydomonas_euryale.AAC.2